MWPEVVEIERPASTIRGATISPRGGGVADGEGGAAAVAEVADGGEAGLERLAGIGERAQGLRRRVLGHLLDQAAIAAGVGIEMDVAVDQAGQDEAVRKVDQARARRAAATRPSRTSTIRPPAIDDRRRAARRPAGPVEQPAGMDVGHSVQRRRAGLGGGGGGERRARRRRQAGAWISADGSCPVIPEQHPSGARCSVPRSVTRSLQPGQLLDLGLELGELGAEPLELLLAAAVAGGRAPPAAGARPPRGGWNISMLRRAISAKGLAAKAPAIASRNWLWLRCSASSDASRYCGTIDCIESPYMRDQLAQEIDRQHGRAARFLVHDDLGRARCG